MSKPSYRPPLRPLPCRFKVRAVISLALVGTGAVVVWVIQRPESSWVDTSIVPEAGRSGNDASLPTLPPAPARPGWQPPTLPPWPGFLRPLGAKADLEPLAVPPPRLPVPQSAAVTGAPLPTQPPIAFLDVPPDYWAKAALDDLSARGLLRGLPEGTFEPERPMTRAELAAQVAKLFNLPARLPASSFSDVSPDNWAAEPIRRSVQMGFLKGLPESSFEPDKPVTRVEVVVAIANGLSLSSTAPAATVLQRYSDRSELPGWAVAPLVAATEAGLVVNSPDPARLEPNRPATRAEVAVMMHRALVYLGQVSEVPVP